MKKHERLTVRDLVLAGVFAAILVVLSQIAIPLPTGVPLTLQTFAVALCGFALGVRLGTISVVVYLLLGAIGLPVFAGFAGGIGVFFGVTGGFLWGFVAMAALCGVGNPWLAAAGLLACHALGVAQFSVVARVPLLRSVAMVSLPYLLKDALSVAVAYLASRAVIRGLRAARL